MPVILNLAAIHRMEALDDADPLVRISAIHYFGQRLRSPAQSEPSLRERLARLLSDQDRLVSRYVAVTLAESGDREALGWLLAQIVNAQGADQDDLKACLRSCSQFPFAALISERVALESLRHLSHSVERRWLERTLQLRPDEFRQAASADSIWRSHLLDKLCEVHRIPGLATPGHYGNRVLQRGRLLSLSNENQPGFLFWPETGVFLQYFPEAVLNRPALLRGREVLFVANPRSPTAEIVCLYVLEDAPAWTDEEILQTLTPDLFDRAISDSPLIPGVVVALHKGAIVLCLNGVRRVEQYLSKHARLGQLALLHPDDEGRPLAHFVPGLLARSAVPNIIVSRFAQQDGSQPARIVRTFDNPPACELRVDGSNRSIRLKVSAPFRVKSLLVRKCSDCQTKGCIDCPPCGGKGQIVCSGTHSCSNCRGSGQITNRKTQETYPCRSCMGNKSVQGCEGSTKVKCQNCQGASKLDCPRCRGVGNTRAAMNCRNCAGSGSLTCSGCQGTGRKQLGDCRACRQSPGQCGACRGRRYFGSNPCRVCNAVGTCTNCDGTGVYSVDCNRCSGQGIFHCTSCRGTGRWEAIQCDLCKGTKKLPCRACNAMGIIPCRSCNQGKRPCQKCGSSGKLLCHTCGHQGWLLAHRIECDLGAGV